MQLSKTCTKQSQDQLQQWNGRWTLDTLVYITKRFCDDVSKILGVDVAIADVNDLGKVKILDTSNKLNLKILEKNLTTNPAGNDDQKTPIVIIRKNKI